VADSTVLAQKILSCVARVEQRFGAGHVIDVLVGADTEPIRRWRHERLSTYGLLRGTDKKTLGNYVDQLIDARLLERTPGGMPVLHLNDDSWRVMRGEREVRLIRPRSTVRRTRADELSWEGVDRGLFDRLSRLRRRIADERQKPAYVVFTDATLREMARLRPGSPPALRSIRGVGDEKLRELGPLFLTEIAAYCAEHSLELDVPAAASEHSAESERFGKPRPQAIPPAATRMFRTGCTVAEVASAVGRAESTVSAYLEELIRREPPESLDPWVDRGTYERIAAAVRTLGGARLKPIFLHFDGRVPYDQIRLVIAHLEATGDPAVARPAGGEAGR